MNHRLEFLRKRALGSSIREGRRKKEPIELIIKTEFRKRDSLVRELQKFGTVTRIYETLPYLSFRCDAADAYELNRDFRKLADGKTYRSIASAISAIDASARMAIPAVARKKANLTGSLWNLEEIGAYAAKAVASGEGVSVAVIDTGVDYRHPEVSGRFGSVLGYDFVLNKSDPMDMNGHGTHVAGIAVGGNYGVASRARCYALRVLDETGSGMESDAIAALDWVAKHGVDVVNMSMGSPYASSALEDMCYYLANKGVIIAAAAGNNGFGPNYPAAFGEPVIAVAAVDEGKRHADFSNVYETNDISAPGVNITSSYIGGYATLSGTSMASPHAAGGIALVLSAIKKDFDLEELLESTAEKLEPGTFPERDVYGAGLLRVDRMVSAVAASRMRGSYAREILDVVKEVLWA